MKGTQVDILSSTILSLLLYFHGWYDLVFIVITTILYIYKGPYPAIAFPYPSILALELCFLIIGGPILEYARLYFGRRGNLTEKGWPLILFLIFCIPTIFAHVYFIAWQALQIELPLNIISFVFLAFEMVFAVVYFVIFQRKSSL